VKVFAIDLDICNGCYCCQVACKDEHCGNDWMPYAKPQPETGQFWIGIDEKIRGQVPKVKITYLVHLCQHCDDAPCIASCAYDAIYKREDGMVIIDPAKCVDCQLCEDACPHGAIFMNKDLNIAQKCTGCSHLRDNDAEAWPVPRCVDNCPTGAIKFGEEEEFAEFIKNAELLNPEKGTKSRVYYKGLPKKFVGGTLYDPIAKEVIIGAKCTLKDNASGETLVVMTDNYGDFWFKDLKDDREFTLTLEKNGKSKTITDVSTAIDLSLGDIPMEM
jgi:tetrathionate reductase subunit B